MGRITHLTPARPSGAVHWLLVAVVIVLAAAAGTLALGQFLPELPAATAPTDAVPLPAPRAPPPLATAAVTRPMADSGASTGQAPAPNCPIQALQLALDGRTVQTVCVDGTRVQQTGNIRSYVVRAGGVDAWDLRIDVAAGNVAKVALVSRDGRVYACESSACAAGVRLGRHDRRGVRSITLREQRLVRAGIADGAPSDELRISARLQAPPDDQVPGLACLGVSVAISAPDGSATRFCGQGGASVEMADDGTRHYRFDDFEGGMLAISASADGRIASIRFGAYACAGSACNGASLSSAVPDNDLAERSFHFGRTALTQSGKGARAAVENRPALLLDGTLVMPAQE